MTKETRNPKHEHSILHAPAAVRSFALRHSFDLFSVLGVAPFRGRLFNADDDRRGGGPSGVVISYAFWQSEFGGQESAVGKSLSLGDRVFQVIGVTPPAFFGLEVGRNFDVAVPVCARAFWWEKVLDRADAWWLTVTGRLKAGTTLAQAAQYLNAVSPGVIEATLPTGYDPGSVDTYRKFRLSAFPAGTGVSQLRSDYEMSLWLLLGITGSVLAIACVNLARFLAGLLFDLKPTDPPTLLVTSMLLVAVAALGSWLPAHRAARVQPMEALRYE